MKGLLSVLLATALAATAVMAETGIAGTVTDAETGDPIAGARVMASPRGGSARTDPGGDYLISLKDCCGRGGAYVVSASAPGYETAFYPETVYVERGQIVENIDLALEPATPCTMGYVTGEVTDEATGRVIRGALVKAEREGFSREVTQGCCRYRIPLPAGRYWVSATAPGYEPGSYGDSVEVVAGRTTGDINFTLAGAPGERGAVAGTVTDAETGEPLLGAYVVARGPTHGYANTDEEGAYLIESLMPGTYEVTAKMRGYLPAAPQTVEVVANQTVEDIDFALEPRAHPGERGYVAGTVTDAETGDPIENARVRGRGGCGQGGALTNEDGEYLLGLRPGAYLLRASARWYLPTVYPETVLVAANETLFGIDFALEPVERLRAAVGGWVFDRETQAELGGVRVTAIGPDRSYETVTDDWGEYLFASVEPGDYRIAVSRAGYEPTIYRRLVTADPDEARPYSTPAMHALTGVEERPGLPAAERRLEVRPSLFSRTSTVRYSLPTPGRVSLRVTDAAGRVVATLQDGVLPAGRHEATWDGNAADGRRLADGVYFYRLEAPGLHALEKVVLTGR